MITTILTLLGGSLGGILRFVPEILKMFTAGKDQTHEYRMTLLQLDIDKARAAQGIDLVHAQGEANLGTAEMAAYIEAIKGQSQLTGVGWVDAVNATVRPFIAYWWMTLFTLYKLVLIFAAAIEFYLVVKTIDSLTDLSPAMATFASRTWTAQDAGTLSMILGFWYVDRVIRKG